MIRPRHYFFKRETNARKKGLWCRGSGAYGRSRRRSGNGHRRRAVHKAAPIQFCRIGDIKPPCALRQWRDECKMNLSEDIANRPDGESDKGTEKDDDKCADHEVGVCVKKIFHKNALLEKYYPLPGQFFSPAGDRNIKRSKGNKKSRRLGVHAIKKGSKVTGRPFGAEGKRSGSRHNSC